jgi:hypothetical protein
VPEEWLGLIWYCHGVYLETEAEHGADDSVTSMVQLLGLLTWPKRVPRKKNVQVKYTPMTYKVRDLAGAWNSYLVPPNRLSRIRRDQVAMKIRTGRWAPTG